jgi:N-acetylglucosaminyldiphosphoundecaprenol N-acetyl-beta-D-mannosaminyltransferase
MTISIITASYGQLDWLRLCVASVADQICTQCESGRVKGEKVWAAENKNLRTFEPSNLSTDHLAIEHIIQDGGTPGIEEFVRVLGEDLKSRYGGNFVSELQPFELLHLRTASGYTLRVFKENDAGMYDAINKGIAKISGDLWAWINSDEQYLPETLSYVREWFGTHPDADVLCGDALLTDREGHPLSYRRIVRPLWHHTRLVHLSSLSCASFYRRSILERVGHFDTTWRSIGDAEWMARIMKAGLRIEACGKLLSTFAFTGQNTSESPLARKESEQWKTAEDAPSGWMRLPVIWGHRLRKFMAGAYGRRSFCYEVHRNGAVRTAVRAEGIGWDWPTVGSASKVSLPGESHRDNSRIPYADTTKVLGTRLMETTYERLSGWLHELSSTESGVLAIDFANTHIVTMRRHDPHFRAISECIDLAVPDGMPLVWAMNAKGAGLKDRVYGPTFTRRFLATCPQGKTHYLMGGSEECGRGFRKAMEELNPTLEFIGGYHGRCSVDGVPDTDDEVLAEIREKRPDFIWVGLGTPKQYAWINRMKPLMDHGILLAVGFAFDVNAGMKPDAPEWMQAYGLTWMHRLASEPGRLAGRYMKWNTLFLLYRAADMAGEWIRVAKLHFRKLFLRLVDLLASEIHDHRNGRSLGRAVLLGWGGGFRVIGHEGLPPLIPQFLPQGRLTYWKQSIGFTTTPRPDFPRLECVRTDPVPETPRVLNVVLTHIDGTRFHNLRERWRTVCNEEDLWIAFGGKRHRFDTLGAQRSVFIGDAGLRRDDNQREKQSYTGIFHAMAPIVEKERPDFIYLSEYDHIPLRADLNALQVAEISAEGADVMGHWLYRVDGTSHYHMLYHQSDPGFLSYWESVSKRQDKGVVLSMFGSGSFWSREAFLAVAARKQEISCYLEIYLPTLAHHLGYRVRCWDESRHMISNLPSGKWTADAARGNQCLTIHPVK